MGLHQPECVKLARSRLAIEDSGRIGPVRETWPRRRVPEAHAVARTYPKATFYYPDDSIITHEDAIVVETVLRASSDSEVLGWKRSCYLIGKCLLAKTRSTYTNNFLLELEVVKKQYPESAKREECK